MIYPLPRYPTPKDDPHPTPPPGRADPPPTCDPDPTPGMTRTRNGSTRRGRRENARILAASDTCGICGHPGSDAVDHIIPLALGGADTPANKQPAHHDVACSTCGQQCNRSKGAKIVPPTIRRSGALTSPRTRGPA